MLSAKNVAKERYLQKKYWIIISNCTRKCTGNNKSNVREIKYGKEKERS